MQQFQFTPIETWFMKDIKIIAPIVILVLVAQSLKGQPNNLCDCAESVNYQPNLSGELFVTSLPVDESTYFSKKWLIGNIFLSNGEVAGNKTIRYNGLLDELFWLEPKSKSIIKLDKGSITRFHFRNFEGDTSVYFKKIKVKRDIISDSSEIFGQEIYNGKLSLFVLHTFFIQRREIFYKKGIPYQKTFYEEESIYYFRFLDNKTVGFKSLGRKSLYAMFPDDKDQIKKFCRKSKLGKFKKNSELISLTQFLGTLVKQ
jgi:hypothetical protein